MNNLFTAEYLKELLPPERANDFFEALFGDVNEGAYDISLHFASCNEKNISLELRLQQRPGHCLACNLTHGLPTVFSRHPIIDIAGIVKKIEASLEEGKQCTDWSLGQTQQKSSDLHCIPLTISIA